MDIRVMEKIELTVHEFMTIMGSLDEKKSELNTNDDSIYEAWFPQWKALDERLEKLDMMERADMLFDGKIAINAISESHFQQLLRAVTYQIQTHTELIEKKDEDADPEDCKMWEERLSQLNALNSSLDWTDPD